MATVGRKQKLVVRIPDAGIEGMQIRIGNDWPLQPGEFIFRSTLSELVVEVGSEKWGATWNALPGWPLPGTYPLKYRPLRDRSKSKPRDQGKRESAGWLLLTLPGGEITCGGKPVPGWEVVVGEGGAVSLVFDRSICHMTPAQSRRYPEKGDYFVKL